MKWELQAVYKPLNDSTSFPKVQYSQTLICYCWSGALLSAKWRREVERKRREAGSISLVSTNVGITGRPICMR